MRSPKHRNTRRSRRHHHHNPFCSIPIPAPASNYSSKTVGDDFYVWVNESWLETIEVPDFENDFGASEEIERCIYEKAVTIIHKIKKTTSLDGPPSPNKMIRTLADSCLHSRNQHTSLEFLRNILGTLACVKTKEDVVQHFAEIAKARFSSIFNMEYFIDSKKRVHICLDANSPNVSTTFYREKSNDYKKFLRLLGEHFNIPNLEDVVGFERSLLSKLDEVWTSDKNETTGNELVQKFPKFPWEVWFSVFGLEEWKTMKFFYRCPAWIRFISQILDKVSIENWKLLIARTYILNSLPYLPPPFDELDYAFFDKGQTGQKIKTPQMELLVRTVYTYLNDDFSEIIWRNYGDESVVAEQKKFVNSLLIGAKERIRKTDWMTYSTRTAAIEKINKIRPEIVRPKVWAHLDSIELDDQNLLRNIFLLGAWNTSTMFKRIGKIHDFWEEGIFRVNAYYFNENNEIMIPFGTVQSPFYSSEARPGWNLGGLGSIVAHEICHAFDEDGKKYGPDGEKKKWWSRKDNYTYSKKTKKLIELYDSQKIGDKHVNGKKTLSENIADIGGVAIALQALKYEMRNSTKEELLTAYRNFFISFAVSWRTKYRKEKLMSSLETDRHAPAYLRVNLVVSQFDEWYEAFDITENTRMYRKPENRICIF